MLPASGRRATCVDNLAIMEPVAPRSSFEVGQNAAEIVAPEWDVIGPDTAGIGDALKSVLGGAAKNPADVMTASIRLSSDLARIPSTVLNSWIRKPKGDDKAPSDRRFADPAWTDDRFSRDPAGIPGAMRVRAIACRLLRCRCQAGGEGVPWAEPVTGRCRPHESWSPIRSR